MRWVYDGETLLQIISKETENYQAVKQFIEMCLYDALIGNHDRHGRNLGFVVTKTKKTFSPVYDNVSALGLEQGSILKAAFSPKGKIYTKHSQEPTMQDYVQEFSRLGYKIIVEDFFKKIQYEKIKKIILAGFYSELMKEAMVRLFSLRYQEFQNALSTK